MLRVRLHRLLLRVIGNLPLSVVQGLGMAIGAVILWSRSRTALVTRENIAICFPEMPAAAQRTLVRRSLVETGKTIVESAFAWTATGERCQASIVEVEGQALVDAAIARGRGLIFIIPHLGNWEMINHFLGGHYGLIHMYQRNSSKELNAMIQAFRTRTGTRFVETDRSGIKAQLVALRNAATVGAMPDQEPEVHTGHFADFFGVPCLTNRLIPSLARRTGAATVVAWCERLPSGAGFRVVFEPVDLATANSEQLALASMNAAIERMIRRAPAQYLWSYKRFRTRPAGEAERYKFRDHPLQVWLQTLLLRLALLLSSIAPLRVVRQTGKLFGHVAGLARTRHARLTRTNLTLCASALRPRDIRVLEQASLCESGKALLETGNVWYSADEALRSRIIESSGLQLIDAAAANGSGLIVLTPPLGNREVVLRFLASNRQVTEYYYPNSTTALDDLIRRQRDALGIRLVPHTRAGISQLVAALSKGEMVTMCPDQQPRLRMGEFVPFFGVEALTTTTLATLVKESGAPMVFATAIRVDEGYSINIAPCEISGDCVLTEVNKKLGAIILANPAQYRWSDKRFNIRPQGARKVYRRAR